MTKGKQYLTSLKEKHRHVYREGNKFTSYNAGHKHKVRGKVALPHKKGGHEHKILKKLLDGENLSAK